MRWSGWWAALVLVAGCAGGAGEVLVRYVVEGDAIRNALTPAGDAARGREIAFGRDGNCLLCHTVPNAGKAFMGNLGPPLVGVGTRLSAGQLRLRVVDSTRLNLETIMPPYYRVEGLNRVGAAWRGRPVLTAQQVEDVVAFLQTLR